MYEAIKCLRDIYKLSLRVTDAAVSEDYRSTVANYHCALVYALGYIVRSAVDANENGQRLASCPKSCMEKKKANRGLNPGSPPVSRG